MSLEFDVAETGNDSDSATAVADRPEDMVNGPDEAGVEYEDHPKDGAEVAADDESQPVEQASEFELEPELTPEQKQIAEEKHRLNIDSATEEHKSLAVQRSDLEGQLKDLKASEKAALKRLIWLMEAGPVYPKPAKANESTSDDGDEDSAGAVINEDTSWREIHTSTLLDGIKGMGAKKVEAMIELAPTLGDLEDLRAEASVEHEEFRAKLPRGIGKEMTDELEERMLGVISKHCASS